MSEKMKKREKISSRKWNKESVEAKSETPPPESFYSLRLREWSRQIPIASLSLEWEKCILNLLPCRLKIRHPKCLEKTLKEVQDLYKKEMVNCGVGSIVGAAENEQQQCQTVTKIFDHRSEYRYSATRQRQLLSSKYFLSHNIMRLIIDIASVKLNGVVVDLDSIVQNNKNRDNLFELATLQDAMENEVARVAGIIKNEFYYEIVKIIVMTICDEQQSTTSLSMGKKMGKKSEIIVSSGMSKKIKVLSCATNLFTQQIIQMMIRTVDDITERLSNYRLQCPRLNLRLVWKSDDNRLSIDPPISQIFFMWHSLVRSIENIADGLPSFEQRAMMTADDSYEEMKISLPDWYSVESHRKIDRALTSATDSLKKYSIKMADEFESVTSLEVRNRIVGSSRSNKSDKTDMDFHSSIKILNEENERANTIPECLDVFEIGKLQQSPARVSLIEEIAGTRKNLVDGMLRRHEEFNEKICQDFRDLRDKLLNVPNTARELFELSEMIAYSSMSRLLEEFEARVARSVEMLNSLLAVTSDMTERQTRLNGATINWLAEIKPIVVKSNTLCEAMKSELEDELQRRIGRFNQEIEAVIPKFEILDLMDDATRVDEYEGHIKELLGHLNDLDRQIQEINYEESLFKFPETSFSSVEEIRDILLPVSTLNNLVREWRRDHAVWMHGPFEYIDAGDVRRKTSQHYRQTFEKLNSSLKAKIKNDMQQSGGQTGSGKRFKMYSGIVDDPDPMQQPAPLSLCSQALEEVKRFEGHLELIDCVCNPSLRERHWQEISLIYEQSRRLSLTDDRSRSLSSSSALDVTSKPPGSTGEPMISAPDAGTTLAKLIRLDLAKDIEKYKVISIGANKELALATRLEEMIARWETVDFNIVDDSTFLPFVLKTFLRLEEIETLFDEHEVAISEMRVSYFVKPILAELGEFSKSLSSVSFIVRTWLELQRDWHDLELVFHEKIENEDLNGARPLFFNVKTNAIDEVEQFISNDPRFKTIVEKSSKLSKIISQAQIDLETVRETVEHFIEKVRGYFPRFYFIADREVIDMLFEPEYPKKMRFLVRKCFTDMSDVKCSSVNLVTSIIETTGGEFPLIHSNKELDINSDNYAPLVHSFITIEENIRRTIRTDISECFNCLSRKKIESLNPEEIVATLTNRSIELAGICGLWLYWTNEMERALKNEDPHTASKILGKHNLELSNMIRILIADLKSEETSRARRRTFVLFAIQCYEQRDVTEAMMSKVRDKGSGLAREDFYWRSQIRYHLHEDDVKVTIFDTEILYGCEFSSCNQRDAIIRTSLTERCFHSLMEAYRNRLYALVHGPEATGKTRTVQALAHLVGVDLRIFDGAERHLDNCRFMENVFQGLVSRSCCWLLFKNLDSITIPGLSVFAQRITFISSMENQGFVLGTISSHPEASGARYYLPDALKILFRPIAFAFPDTKRIVEVSLFAEGFSEPGVLAEKLRLFEKYSNQQAPHLMKYFYGSNMKIIKSVLRTVCGLKLHYPEDPEETLLVRALVDVHLPKFTNSSDLNEFQHLMDDLFPNVFLPPPKFGNLVSSINRVLESVVSPAIARKSFFTLILKIIQLYESLLVRQAVIVVGSSLSGKTTVIETLARSLTLLENTPVINPVRIHQNSLTSKDLFGSCSDSGKLSWKDGVLTRILRHCITGKNLKVDGKEDWHWLILDGPLQSPSIDKLNTMLDENDRSLSLSSGERIHLTSSISIIFETSSTINATPATISNCGIVHLDESSTIDWKTRIRQWITQHQRQNRIIPHSTDQTGIDDVNDEYGKFVQSLLEWSLGASLNFARKKFASRRNCLVTNENHMVLSVLRLFEIFLMHALDCGRHQRQETRFSKASSSVSSTDRRFQAEEDEHPESIKNLNDERAKLFIGNFYLWSQAALLMSIVWGLAGSLNRDDRIALDEFCKSIWRANPDFRYDMINTPGEGLIQDHTYVFTVGTSGAGCWRHCAELLKRDTTHGDMIDQFWDSKANATSYVSTVDSVRYISLFKIHVKYRSPFIVSGETAIGKSLYMRHLLKTKMNSNWYQTHFSSLSDDSPLDSNSSKSVQSVFLSRMKKLKKRVYGPGEDARLCINFVDDMSIVTTSKREVILRGLIRQYYEDSTIRGCWYDVENGEKIALNDVLFLGAIDSRSTKSFTTDESYESARFFRHFNLYKIDRSSDESIFRIYHTILLSNLRANMFSADVSSSVTNIVQASLQIYSSLVQELKPAPNKLQYRFNLRDVSRLIDGCSLIHKESAETKVTLMRLWVHESIRVFADRIIDHQDMDLFLMKMKECAASHFKDSWETVFDNLPKQISEEGVEHLTRESFRHLMFSNLMRLPDTPVSEETSRRNGVDGNNDGATYRYEEITCSRDALKNRAIFFLDRFNEQSKKKLDIIIFSQMLEHLMRICRILNIPGGSLLMMCFGGSSGRRSLTALAAHVKAQRLEELSAQVIETIMTPNSKDPAWREDFKRACMNCIGDEAVNNDLLGSGTDSKIRDSTFFISDREIIGSTCCPNILGDICSLMKRGQVTSPNFFTVEERDRIVERCRLLAQKGDRNREMRSHEIMDYFYDKCQEKLHFVLYFDRSVMMRRGKVEWNEVFDKIMNQCTVDCFENWPEEALTEIGNKFLKDVDIDSQVRLSINTASRYFWKGMLIAEVKEDVESSVNKYRGLPVSAYIHMIKLYGLSIRRRQHEIRTSREKYLNGLDKLKSADEEVRKMRSTLTRLRPELELSAQETAETMRKIERENVSVEQATIQVKREEEVANGIAEVASILKEECEADLAVAIPILEDAIAALNTLKPADITLVKAMKNPPDTVKLVLAAVCVMLGVPPDRSTDPVTGKKSIDYWAPSKRILGDMNFLQNLKDYDKDNIPASVMSVVNKSYMNDESFMPHIVAKASSAAEGLCKWVRAMVSYDEVAKVVAPKKEKLAGAERECNASLRYLNEKRKSLAALNDKLAVLNASLQATLAKKLQLENEVASCTAKLNRAESLIASLAGEKARWLEAVETLARTCDNLAGDVLLSCGIVAILSSLSASQRQERVTDWRRELDRLGIPNSGDCYEFLGSLKSSEIRTTSSVGMSVSHQYHRLSVNSPFNRANASILEHSLLWPLILDPQNQANMWIKQVESSNGLVVVKPTNPRWFAEIRTCIEKNLPVLLENLDRPEYLERTPSIIRYFGTSETFSFSSAFRFYMTSRISFNEASSGYRLIKPHNMYKRFSVVNFTLANNALEERLLEIIVSRERPELRETFDRLMITSATNRRLLEQEEEKILQVLSGSSVNIIEDERAIESLDRWKNLSHEMRMREVETATATEGEMNELRTTYRPLTQYCAALYDTLACLVDFNHMYRFSLDWFVRLYVRSIDTSMRSVFLDKRLSYLGSSFTLTLDASVRNALLDEHKLLYSLLLSIKILLDTNKMDRAELRALFLTRLMDCKCEDDYSLGSESVSQTSSFEIRDQKFLLAQQLGNALPNVFQKLSKSFQEDYVNWERYWNGSRDESLPEPWCTELTDFQRLILINRLRPEKTLVEVLRLVQNTLGWNSITSSSSTRMRDNIMARSYDESSCVVPLIFVLPSYLEPFGMIKKWAKTIGYSSRVLRFSIPPTSPREYSEIEKQMETARGHGGWILLENCHLASDEWLARLEEISESLGNNENIALSFRLWLTSYPSTKFPISILHDGTKLYCEQPTNSIKQSLLDFYATEPLDDPDFYNPRNGGNNARVFSKLVFALCFFHAVVTGRTKFYNLGWNATPYEFTDSDLKISILYLRQIFSVNGNGSTMKNRKSNIRDEEAYEENILKILTYLVGECYYGGRILDITDRRCLDVILRDSCNRKLLRSTTNYVFDCGKRFASEGHEYSVPNRTEYRDFIRHIKECLPDGDAPPQIFALDENAAILRDFDNSDYFVHSLARSLSFIDSDISAHPDEPNPPRLLDIVEDVRMKLSLKDDEGRLDLSGVKDKYQEIYEEPLNFVIIEQVEFYNKLIDEISSALVKVEMRACELEYEFVNLLTQNKVPRDWMMLEGVQIQSNIDVSSLSRFIDCLSRRRIFLTSWTKSGHYETSLWLGGMINCRKFLLAVRQTFSRKWKIPLDRFVLNYEVTKIRIDGEKPWNFNSVPSDLGNVIYIHGIYLSGARWDIERCTLSESQPKLYWNPIPMIRLQPRIPDAPETKNYPQNNLYLCPLNYSSSLNKKLHLQFLGSLSMTFISRIPLNSKDTPIEYWIKRRTILLCNKDQ